MTTKITATKKLKFSSAKIFRRLNHSLRLVIVPSSVHLATSRLSTGSADARLRRWRLYVLGVVKCSYCKRNGQFTDDNGNIIDTADCDMTELQSIIAPEIAKGCKIRRSGGDPCTCIKELVELHSILMKNTDSVFIKKTYKMG